MDTRVETYIGTIHVGSCLNLVTSVAERRLLLPHLS